MILLARVVLHKVRNRHQQQHQQQLAQYSLSHQELKTLIINTLIPKFQILEIAPSV